MSENEVQTTDTPEVVEKPTISETELEELRANSVRYSELDKVATDMGYSNHAEYQAFLEQTAYNNIQEDGKKVEVTKPKTAQQAPQQVQQVQQPAPQQNDPLVIQAYLEGQYAQYLYLQSQKPEDQRGNFTKQQLLTVIQGPKTGVVQQLMASPDMDGNAFIAAQYLIEIPGSKKQAQQEATQTVEALNTAKETAKISTDAPPPEKKVEKSVQEIEADTIASDDIYVYPGD